MDKRTLLAVVFAISIMVLYSHIVQKLYPASKSPASLQADKQDLVQKTTVSTVPFVSSFDDTVRAGDKVPAVDIRRIITDSVDYELSDTGGCIKSITIKKYNELKQSGAEEIYNAEFLQDAIFSISGLDASQDLLNARYKYSYITNGAGYSLLLENKLLIKKTYTISDHGYGLILDLKITNTSDRSFKGEYFIVGASNIKALTAEGARFIESVISSSGKRKRIKPAALKNKSIYFDAVDWAALQNKYFSIAVKPYHRTVSSVLPSTARNFYKTNISIQLGSGKIEITPGESVFYKFLLYSGPSKESLMSVYQAGFEKAVNLGVFSDISKLLLLALNFFYKVTHNYGVAIILLALLISMVLYPLTFKSLKSMKQMQMLQPKMDKLRRDFKNNPQKLNKEILELYKKHKVNPFGGCLPMILQMPIFLALYQAFSRAIELKGAGFLWIKDLSRPDMAFQSPFPINILPILMAITMFFQQRMTMTGTRSNVEGEQQNPMQQQQKMMMFLMPVLFGFIFYNMASGLVLYWFLNTIIMFFQQIAITKKFHVEKVIA